MSSTHATKCRKCNDTGKVPSRVDGGRCWSCGPVADTSYTRRSVGRTESQRDAEMAEIDAEMAARQAERREARRARRLVRS